MEEIERRSSTESRSSDQDFFGWDCLPDDLILNIFYYLDYESVLKAGSTCKAWNRVSYDELLWRDLFYSDFGIDRSITIAPGKKSWLGEYKRLMHHCPSLQTEVLGAHRDEVLHVSFSHNGKYFATCSKDSTVIIWTSSYPATLKYSFNMRQFSWMYTQFSQFNRSDSHLLVSGVHFGCPLNPTGSGEIAVFSLTGGKFQLQCRVKNKPYDVFGAWYSNHYLLSGDFRIITNAVHSSELWLIKASQEAESEHVPIMNLLHKFLIICGAIRALIVASVIEPEATQSSSSPVLDSVSLENVPESSTTNNCSNRTNVDNSDASSLSSVIDSQQEEPSSFRSGQLLTDAYFTKSPSGRPVVNRIPCTKSNSPSANSNQDSQTDGEESDEPDDLLTASENLSETEDSEGSNCSTVEDLGTEPEKYVIFFTGEKTLYPHQIGFKKIKPASFPVCLPPGPTLAERIAIRDRERQREIVNRFDDRWFDGNNWLDFDSLAARFDKVDHTIDLHGHIIGMALSPDHRYLYVNVRPWPENYVIEDPFLPPPIAQEIDIHVIDMTTLQETDTIFRSHKAYTPANECSLIFLNVSDEYLASGAEDKHGYIWDRHYGKCLAKFPHTDMVNSVAFNPQDPEMFVTTSDDYSIKVWRSKARTKELVSDEILSSFKKCVFIAHKPKFLSSKA